MIEGQARILFVKLPYTLATEEAERIGENLLVAVIVYFLLSNLL